MKRLYLKFDLINSIFKGETSPTSPVGYTYDEDDKPYVIFLATERETGKLFKDKKGNVAMNVKAARSSSKEE